jgi:hypothetical protein
LLSIDYLKLLPMKRILCIALLTTFSFYSYGSHLLGGDITWKCLPSGEFVFQLKLYRDCTGIGAPTTVNIRVHNYAPNLSMSLPANAVIPGGADISPKGPGCPTCNPNAPVGTIGAVAEWIYETAPVFLTGTPPAAGWVFTYDYCCRNSTIVNLQNPGTQGLTLRAIMYSHNGQNTNPCFDSSPYFVEKPPIVLCTQNQVMHNHLGYDDDRDSLVFSWGESLHSLSGSAFPPPLLSYTAGYSFDSPFPGISQNSLNVPANLDPFSGYLTATSLTTGNFVYVVKATSYRYGIKISEVFNEMSLILVNDCIISNAPLVHNTPPEITPPFKDSTTGLFTLYSTTVSPGDTVKFFMSSTDFEFLPAGPPTYGAPQSLTIEASSQHFGQGFTSATSGCVTPPCATLNPPPPITAMFGAGINFNWRTTQNHIQPGKCFSDYYFFIKVIDNYCTTLGIFVKPITVRVAHKIPVAGAVSGLSVVNEYQSGVTYSIQPVAGATIYYWTVPSGAVIISGQGTPAIQVDWGLTGGNVSVTVGNTCGSGPASVFPVTTVPPPGTGPVKDEKDKMEIFPNPVNGELSVRLNEFAGDVVLIIQDMTGREIMNERHVFSEQNTTARIDLSGVNQGCYLLTGKFEEGQIVKKIIRY